MQGMCGALIVNSFLKGNKYSQIYSLLIDGFKTEGIDMTLLSNDEVCLNIGESVLDRQYDFILFWDKDIVLAKRLERQGYRLFNRADAIEICDDKRLSAIALENTGIRMPKTIISPFTFANVGYVDTDFLTNVVDELGFPLIVKEAHGSFGEQVYLIENMETLSELTRRKADKGLIYQEFVTSSIGRDVRVQVIGGEVVACVERQGKEGSFISNVSGGGWMRACCPPKQFTDMALKVCSVIGLDFAGVDILYGNDGEPILCEVNASAHFKNLLDATGINTAEILARYINAEVRK